MAVTATPMAKPEDQLDVLVLGSHPCAYLCAGLLGHNSKLRVLHATIPGHKSGDRLIILNPAFFKLHKLLPRIRRHLDLTPVYGAQFLADDAATRGEYRSRAAVSLIGSFAQMRQAMVGFARSQDVSMAQPRQLCIHRIDERGLEVSLDRRTMRPRAMVLAEPLLENQQKMLGIPESWGRDVVHRYSFVRFNAGRLLAKTTRPLIPMSLDLKGMLFWGWLLRSGSQAQLAVEQPLGTVAQLPPAQLLQHWVNVLMRHGILSAGAKIPMHAPQSIDVPFGGALMHEGLASRTLLIGPAGGFYSTCAEDIYPNCWSAQCAVDVLKNALREAHLQDALQAYRSCWRTTLGEYLRGPQQNLRFLLPLVYRNPVMTTRIAEAILLGKNVVR